MTTHLHRAHECPLGIDTNAAQFERMGNPWVTQREAQLLGNSPKSRKLRRVAQNFRKRPFNPEFRDEARVRRELTVEEQRTRKHLDTLDQIRRLTRSAVIASPIVRIERHDPPAKVSLLHSVGRRLTFAEWSRKVDQRNAERARAEAAQLAFAASEAGKQAERVRLNAIIEAAEQQLAQL